MRFLQTVIVFTVFVIGIHSESNFGQEIQCMEYDVCGSCVSSFPSCRWCADPYFSSTLPRCDTYDRLLAAGCSQTLIQKPDDEFIEEVQNSPLQDYDRDHATEVVQIQPQKIHLTLKPRQSKKIEFKYRPARNYPLDIYYLMDLTWSMKDDKKMLVSLRDDLPPMLKNLTDNFRLGFGTFAEKPVMPFILVDEKRRADPCIGQDEEVCENTYDFHHRLSLTTEVQEFIKMVNQSTVTANLDDAEAQFDALMQVVVCGERIGWRQQSRKIVILLTDGILHTAGDGRLGGAVVPSDGQCHLDDVGYYSGADIFDYPSVGQIYNMLEKYKVNVIFAVNNMQLYYYKELLEVLDKYAFISELESDSSNILKLVKQGYEEIVSVIGFNDDLVDDNLKIRYFTDCGVTDGPMRETKTCKGVTFGKTLNYEIHISLDSCKAFEKSSKTIKILETHLGQDALTIDLDIQCGCECTESGNMQHWQEACPQNSYMSCGTCQCNKGWSGPKCDCEIGDIEASAALIEQCRNPRTADLRPCSGHGECDCGNCLCDKGFDGKYCQCDDCLTNSNNGLKCGGKDQGECLCGVCQCNTGYSGSACEIKCPAGDCRAPGYELACSGRGTCQCGSCICDLGPDKKRIYSGTYCEMCTTCENSWCKSSENALYSHLSGNSTGYFIDTQNNVTFKFDKDSNASVPEDFCTSMVEDNEMICVYKHSYSVYTENVFNVYLHSKICSKTQMAYINAYYVFAFVVIVGIIGVAMFKCYQIIADRRAYERFVKEAADSMTRGNANFQSPLYISPITEYTLPEPFRDKID